MGEATVGGSKNIVFFFPAFASSKATAPIGNVMDVCRRFAGVEFWTNIFTPYAGWPIMRQVKKHGVVVPGSSEGWAGYFPRAALLPWLKRISHQGIQVMRDYLRIAFYRMYIAKLDTGTAVRFFHLGMAYPAQWRLDRYLYALSFGLFLNRTIEKFVSVAKPKVKSKQLEPTVEANCP